MMNIKFPHSLQFTSSPTPIIPLNNFFQHLSGQKIWIKRDDYTGIELSGNKVRKLDFLIAEAQDKGADHVITCGGTQSNHCRATAFMAVKSRMTSTLFLRGKPGGAMTGNLLLDHLTGANVRYVTVDEYRNIDTIMQNYAHELESSGQRCYVIPEGGSNATGAWGYISCFFEILDQIKNHHLHFDAVFVASGSGGTHAGLLIGKKICSSNIDIVSVNVCDNADFFVTKIGSIIREFGTKYGIELDITKDEIKVIDGFVGAGYGILSPDVSQIIARFARSEGIVLDPVYSAKAFCGLNSILEKRAVNYKNILFIHTGGIFGIFPSASDLIF